MTRLHDNAAQMVFGHLFSVPNVVGVVGTCCVLGSYLFLQIGAIDQRGLFYSVANAVGAGLILVSLLSDFNLASFVMQIAWISISALGIIRFSVQQIKSGRW